MRAFGRRRGKATRRRSARRHRIATPLGSAALVGVVAAGVCATAQPALANQGNCPHGFNEASTACNYQPGVAQNGVFIELNWVGMTAYSYGGDHVGQSLLAYGAGSGDVCPGASGTDRWAELDYVLTNGAYQVVAVRETDATHQTVYPVKTVNANGTSHTFEIDANWPSGTWKEYLDGNLVKTFTGMPVNICQEQAGLEMNVTDWQDDSANNDALNPLKWMDLDGTWNAGWYSTADQWVDNRCGTAPCLNGVFYSTSNWQSSTG